MTVPRNGPGPEIIAQGFQLSFYFYIHNSLPLRLIFKRRYLLHLLFWLMYALFILVEMRYYVNKSGWFFVLGPLSSSLAIMALLVYGNMLLVVPHLLQKRRIGWYIVAIVILVLGFTWFRSVMQKYWDAVIWPDEPMAIESYFHWNFAYTW